MKHSFGLNLAAALMIIAGWPAESFSQPENKDANSRITSATENFSDGFLGELEKVAASHRGIMGISLKHLGTGEAYEVNGDEPFPTASTIKTAVMCAVFEEFEADESEFEDYYETMEYDAGTSTGGSGFIQKFRDGTEIELKELLHLMMTASDNIATNMVTEWLGIGKINGWLEERGFEQTRLFSTVGGKIIHDAEGREEWGLGRTTPNEMLRLMEMIAEGEAGNEAATDEMLRILGNQYFDDRIAGEAPPMIYVGSKSGSVSRSRSDMAIVASPGGTYVLIVFTKENEDRSWDKTNEAEQKIRDVSRLAWQHFNGDEDWERPEGAGEF